MGKIVRGARLVEEAYVVAVPEFERELERLLPHELDGRFGSTPDALHFDDDVALLPGETLAREIVEPAIDIAQVRADARAIVDKAAVDAEAMLRGAAEHAKDLVERATSRAAEIEAKARMTAHAEGVAAGRAAGHAELEEQLAAVFAIVESARAQRNVVIETAEPELVRLAMAVAERVVYDHVAIDPKVVLENVRHALTRLVGREIVTLRVNPADLEILRQYRESTATSNDVEHLRIVEDQRVDRGGVVVETDAGTIDAKVSTQLREARRALQNGDAIAATSASDPSVYRSPAQAS